MYPCGQSRPEASNLNYAAGQTIPNLVIAKPGVGGKVCMTATPLSMSSLTCPGSSLPVLGSPRSPNPTRVPTPATASGCRLAALGAGSTLELQVTGVAGVPSDAAAVVLNVTAVNAPGARVRDGVSVRAVTT